MIGASKELDEEQECDRCGTKVKVRIFVAPGVEHKDLVSHTAPCGQPCWGASVHYKALKLKQLHGHKDYPCPACGKETKE